jgi:2''-5'' RNA ligase
MLYFIAIVAPENINRQVLKWKQYMLQQFNCRVALKSPAHITLAPPFSMLQEREQELIAVLQSFTFEPFSIHLKNFNAFKPRVIYVHVEPNPPLQALKTKLENALTCFPVKMDERPFHPHVSIANRDLEKEDFPAAWAYFKNIQYEAVFEAAHISLLRHNGTHWEIA